MAFLPLSLKTSYCTVLLFIPVIMWDEKMPRGWDGVRWMTILCCKVRLLLTFWQDIRRRIICFRISWVIEPWPSRWLEGRNWLCPRLGISDWSECEGVRFHYLSMQENLKIMNCLFLKISFEYIQTMVEHR